MLYPEGMSVVDRLQVTHARAIPPLDNGARLTRVEFERRYEAMPEIKKAELIEGVVFMASPVSERHCWAQGLLTAWTVVYAAATPGTRAGSDGTVRLDDDNEPQPDVILRVRPEYGGRTRTPGTFIEGAPEFIAEVAISSASIDLHGKLNAYRRNGVREYLVWRVADEAVDWFVLREGDFRPLAPDASGLLESEAFPGLRLDPAALLKDDMARVLAVLQEGISSAAHAAFAADLTGRRAPL